MKPLGVNIDVDRLGLEAAIKRAVEEEREECAKIADENISYDYDSAAQIARAIRARSNIQT